MGVCKTARGDDHPSCLGLNGLILVEKLSFPTFLNVIEIEHPQQHPMQLLTALVFGKNFRVPVWVSSLPWGSAGR